MNYNIRLLIIISRELGPIVRGFEYIMSQYISEDSFSEFKYALRPVSVSTQENPNGKFLNDKISYVLNYYDYSTNDNGLPYPERRVIGVITTQYFTEWDQSLMDQLSDEELISTMKSSVGPLVDRLSVGIYDGLIKMLGDNLYGFREKLTDLYERYGIVYEDATKQIFIET